VAGILTFKWLSLNPEPPMPFIAGATGLIQQALTRYKVAETGVRLGQPGGCGPPGLTEIVVFDKELSNDQVIGPAPLPRLRMRHSQLNQMASCQMLRMKNTVPVRKNPARKTSPSFFMCVPLCLACYGSILTFGASRSEVITHPPS